jgi:tetratricopeptide (TPR) repeat protein
VSASALAAGLPDPKDKLWEFNSILKAGDALRAGDFSRANSLLLQVRDKDPAMYVVAFSLGETAMAQQEWDEAAVEFKTCLELNPHFDQAMLGLARALSFQGKVEEAKQWTRQAIQYNAQSYRAWYFLGSLEARDDRQAAISDYQQAVSIQGNFTPAQRDLGLLQFQRQNYAEAAKHLAQAAALGLNDAVLYNDLGISYSRTGRQHQAIASYEQALHLDPKLAQAHLNLGFAYEQLKQNTFADREYQKACDLNSDLCQLIKQHQR